MCHICRFGGISLTGFKHLGMECLAQWHFKDTCTRILQANSTPESEIQLK